MVSGSLNGPEGRRLVNSIRKPDTAAPLTCAVFEGGRFSAVPHGHRSAAWLDEEGHAWAVLGEPGLKAGAYIGSERRLLLSPDARGVVAAFDPVRRTLSLRCDWLNYFPIYYWHSGQSFLFGSHLKQLAALTGSSGDPAGIVEYLRANWCLNGRTVFQGIRKLLPGQLIEFDASTGRLAITETSRLWAGVPADYTAPTDEDIWDHLLTAVRCARPDGVIAGLMLSGGWDSRVLLAALAHTSADAIVTITHGSSGHGELDLAHRLARRAGVQHSQIAFGPDAVGRPEQLDALLESTEAILFPWWRFAAQAFRAAGCGVAFSGVLGEILGGHYTVVGRGKLRRAQEVFQRSVLRSTTHNLSAEEGLRQLLAQDYRARSMPFLKKDPIGDFERAAARDISEDIEAVLQKYLRRGIGDAGRMAEAYNAEYRGLDYVCQQPLTLTSDVDVALPLGSPRLVESILAVPLTRRIHNSLSRSLLRKFKPELLDVPLAASPFVAASSPILVQEGGRALRHVLDRVARRVYLLTGGRAGAMRRYGWVDFEADVRAGDFLDAWRDSLTWDGLDRAAIDRYIAAVRSYETPVRLARPILKLTYLDRMLRKETAPN